ncbi:YvrJ family protein [Niameybacter massiliensis]|uniref:YvrJ family protein n=1 Tax=Holtiella tumoricola TaxID=3018743 RepID=A0AA42DPM0_9FIRM|nr:YvrJ family protein [Holtiella tumoricola]MDA3733177.1 YvrJ family protein [Holtiella tumoricola]
MNDLLSQIGNFGFPIILSMYLLVRIEGKIETLSTTITHLSNVLEKQEDK